jgi:hypothetical protein
MLILNFVVIYFLFLANLLKNRLIFKYFNFLLKVALRAMSGLLLKNTIKKNWLTLPDPIKLYVKRNCFGAIGDNFPLVRATVGIIITTIFLYENVEKWPELLPTLCQFLETQDNNFNEVWNFYFIINNYLKNSFRALLVHYKKYVKILLLLFVKKMSI